MPAPEPTVGRTPRARATTATVAIALFGTLLTAVGSWQPSYWNDEAASLRLARLDPVEILRFVQEKDAVHAVYALLLHWWTAVFGETEFAVRLPSAIAVGETEFAVRLPSAIAVGATAAAVFVLLRRLDAPRAALPAAIAVLLLPRAAAAGLDARSFALATACLTWSAVALVTAARQPSRGRQWVLLALGLAASVALFLYSALVLPAFVAWALCQRTDRRRIAVRTALASAAALAVTSPLVVLAATQRGQVAWLRDQPVNPWTVGVESVFLDAWWLAAGVLALLVTTLVVAVRRGRRPGPAWLLFLLWVTVPTLALVAATVTLGPLFTPRYLTIVVPAVAGLVGSSIAALRGSWRPVVATALIALSVPSFLTARGETAKPGGQPLRAVATFVQEHARSGDAVVFGTTGTVSLRPRIALAAYPAAFAGLDDVAFRSSWTGTGTYSDRLLPRAATARAELRHDRVWVLVGNDGTRPGATGAQLLGAGYERVVERDFGGITVEAWER
ncbi:glycosyltransferase family 39 protein [Curtobacterium oceanosedimentum]|uniref:glycosyltransferase family 39 protein n=1 Tax=Curtobacterium oceanosedimentum TaxID=465820 RepID=UPI001CE0CAA3|nr:glycosyltransferase family 39 protein [Curtobacterium oceanosedimentum]MCA5923089.1 glycosyltransferase family 39 protein [Curtobacterium oceanosedimentum]